ncbi:MAG: hypothetical protein RLY16_680 [Bacteroidota bacterium]
MKVDKLSEANQEQKFSNLRTVLKYGKFVVMRLTDKWLKITAAHFFCWLLFLGLVVGFMNNPERGTTLVQTIANPYLWLFTGIYILLFYLHANFILPQLYFNRQRLLYFVVLLILMLFFFWLQPFDKLLSSSLPDEFRGGGTGFAFPPKDFDFQPNPRSTHKTDIISIVLFFATCSIGMAIALAKKWQETERIALESAAQRSNAELAFLKAQINPHFLFNTINNIYAMVITGNSEAPNAILKLSSMLRYLTDEQQDLLVPLEKELACIQDFVDLQKLRLGENMTVKMEWDVQITDVQIPPLLLMTFVENAFTHGVSTHQAANIIIRLEAKAGKIFFFCFNQIFPNRNKQNRSGIGITNACKRLDQQYPNQYKLAIINDNLQYEVNLTIII